MKKILMGLMALAIVNCARTYKPVNSDQLTYTITSNSGVSFEYKHHVLAETGNNKYAKKEFKKNISIVAARMVNNTPDVIEIRKDISFYEGGEEFIPMGTKSAVKRIKQGTPWYLFYLLMLPIYVSKTKTECSGYSGCKVDTKTFPLGLILGPGLALLNMGISSSANQKMEKEIGMNDLYDKTVKPGETVSGFLAISGGGHSPLSIKRKLENNQNKSEAEQFEKVQ